MTGGPIPEVGGLRLPPGFRVVGFGTVGSTNDEAKTLARSGQPERTVVWALRQESGRGRRGRAWTSPEGNLYTSTILRPGVPAAVGAQMSFVAALAIADTAATFVPQRAQVRCKWPNDVLVEGRKVAGILLESEAGEGGVLEWLVLGVGINLRHHPEGTEYAATSLAAEGAEETGPAAVLEVYAQHLNRWYERWRTQGFAPIRAAWLSRAVGLGGPVIVRLADQTLHGTFVDLDSDGVLLLDREDGTGRQRIAAGDVFFPAAKGP
ncbi:MAG TPA: biotin--[acetyl-CoA-carboxylase] ligase [Azospirillum sp.]